MSANENPRFEGYSKYEVDLKLQNLEEKIVNKLDRLLDRASDMQSDMRDLKGEVKGAKFDIEAMKTNLVWVKWLFGAIAVALIIRPLFHF